VVSHYKELIVWQKAMELVTEIYALTMNFPDTEKFGLVVQLRRAAVSIPSNIAEGQGRSSVGEFKQFLGHARGSLYEVETQILIAYRLKLFGEAERDAIISKIREVGRLLHGLLKSLRTG